MWQPSIAPMTLSRPHVRWKLVADTLFSQPLGHETKAQQRVDMMVSTWSMVRCADEDETLNLSDISRKQFWLPMYHRNMSTFLAIGRGGQPMVVIALQATLL